MEAHHLTRRTITLSSRTSALMHFCHSAFDISIHPTYLLCSIHVKSASVMSLTQQHVRQGAAASAGIEAPPFAMPPLFMRTCGLTPDTQPTGTFPLCFGSGRNCSVVVFWQVKSSISAWNFVESQVWCPLHPLCILSASQQCVFVGVTSLILMFSLKYKGSVLC